MTEKRHTSELLGDETITAIAQAHGVISARVILRWNLQKSVVVISGSRNSEHIRENLDLYGFVLTEEEMEQDNVLNAGVDINHFTPVTFDELLENNRRFTEDKI